VQEAERRYVALELHDETGQSLTGLMLGLASWKRRRMPKGACSVTGN